MEILLSALLIVKFYAYLAGILSFTLMCAIGVIMAIDELRAYLGRDILEKTKERRKLRKQREYQKRQEELAWADYFSDLPHNFLPDGARLGQKDIQDEFR